MTAPQVAVVVATHRRAHLLPRLLVALTTQRDTVPYEVVVVDDASDDDTSQVLTALAADAPIPVRLLRLPRNRGPAAARNAGWRATSATRIAFTDDDCVPDSGWLAALTAALDRADLVQGRTLPDPQQPVGPFSRTLQVEQEDGLYQTCNVAYRRETLEAAGGFDEAFRNPAGEDTDLAWRAIERGARTAFSAAALVHHDVRPSSVRATLRDTPRWGSVVLAVRKHPGLRKQVHHRWFWRASHPPAIAAAAGLVALAAGRSARTRAAGTGLLLPYARFRLRTAPLPAVGPRRRLALLPAALLVDLAEVGVCAAASVRFRRLLL